jgi:CRISPR-associated protein Cas2
MTLVVICYDIADDRRRSKVARLLEAQATRVQESVFEAYLNAKQLEELLRGARKRLRLEEDSLRVYRLCNDCAGKMKVLGMGSRTSEPALVIV